MYYLHFTQDSAMLTFARLAKCAEFRSGYAYAVKGSLYLSLTDSTPSLSLLGSRGPGFEMPADTGFQPLLDANPTPEELASIVQSVYRGDDDTDGGADVGSMGESDHGVVFAGLG